MPDFVVDDAYLARVRFAAIPHLRALQDSLRNGFPEVHPNAALALGIGLAAGGLLASLNQSDRAAIVAAINAVLQPAGHMLIQTDQAGTA